MDFTIDYGVGPQKRRREPLSRPLEDYETVTFDDPDVLVYTPEVTAPAAAPTAAPAAAAPAAAPDADEDADDDGDTPATAVPAAITATEFYDRFVKRTPEACVAELMAPQRSAEWLAARKHAITASNFGAASGNNKYQSPGDLVIDKLWGAFQGNEATRYGTYHEPDARHSLEALLDGPLKATLVDQYIKGLKASSSTDGSKLNPDAIGATLQYALFETGLLKHADQPWMAVSPDGILCLVGPSQPEPVWLLVEYKCPARLRDSEEHPYKKAPYNVPEYYMDQMQGIMGLFNKYSELQAIGHWSTGADTSTYGGPTGGGPGGTPTGGTSGAGPLAALFVVWQPHQLHVTLVPFQKDYYFKTLEPALEAWYFERYLPLATLQHNGQLLPGTDTASPPIAI